MIRALNLITTLVANAMRRLFFPTTLMISSGDDSLHGFNKLFNLLVLSLLFTLLTLTDYSPLVAGFRRRKLRNLTN
uniref:Uncharacterized protein n=1 Tax=Rhizophora mucronata TaxID=61149 RepID=A0A2P2IU82_RHIMU